MDFWLIKDMKEALEGRPGKLFTPLLPSFYLVGPSHSITHAHAGMTGKIIQ